MEGAPDCVNWEPLADHLSAVGALAGEFAGIFGASGPAVASGLLHDIGKASTEYQDYIAGKGPSPNHSTAGAIEAIRLFPHPLSKMIAFAVAGHHAGLANGAGHNDYGRSTLEQRLSEAGELPDYSGWENHVEGLPDMAAMVPKRQFEPNAHGPLFERAFLTRMLFSCLVDADSIATERFYARVEGRDPPPRGGVLTPDHLALVREKTEAKRSDDTAVNRIRATVLDHAVGKAALPPGLFTLTVPTGGGKTLTSLRFAIEHAALHGLRRIVYVIPYTSIIEQTAAIFRDVLGEDAVLEHHSAFDWDGSAPADGDDVEHEGRAGLAKLRRDSENWDAPVIVTTAVQFFESLFAAKRGKARKLHNLANSVIVLDEAQSLPVRLLHPCLAAIEELANNYGASPVLCTATQPALRRQDGALPKGVAGLDIDDERELAPDPKALYGVLKRVEIEWPVAGAQVTDEDIVAGFAQAPQMLCIVNSRAHAKALYDAIAGTDGACHLTTLMCAKHRRAVLAKLRNDLRHDRPVRLVSTSLIEAGVDVDFPEVWRAMAGLDSIAQSAGRCNREGRLNGRLGRTVVFDHADRPTPRALRLFAEATGWVRRQGLDPLGLVGVREYFKELYFRKGADQLDAATLRGERFATLPAIAAAGRSFDFPFAAIDAAFRLIEETMEPVLIPWDDEARTAINILEHAPLPPAGVTRKLQQYTVPVPANVRAAMLGTGAVQAVRPDLYGDRFVVLESSSLYDRDTGLRLDDPTWRSADSNFIV
ncbi:CRISPR-associated endonuclease Cas3'' [Sphingosinithalassobacter tenebrarum]|uniref:CRISPR-associated endonuclease Cas3 n=1 Tax=Stakelama tenebrarum TaxID=2711215 RepID=A0A6G6YAD7_9SPHN|nr:CRISPR-associated endonuclease Cas3'' [Sphingosinithalassobacter tenebrarum]